jgi:CRP-like cAMP-binding protein
VNSQVLLKSIHVNYIEEMEDILRQHIEKIVTLTDQEFSYIFSHFSAKKYKRREFIFRQGDNVMYLYFVVSGLLMLAYDDDSGKQHVVSFAMEDWWETDFNAFHAGAKASMSLYCLEDTEVLYLSIDNYRALCSNLHKMQHLFLEKANRGHIASQQRILSFITSTATERYEKLLIQYPTLFQRVPKTLLASYLGVSRETLSRLST